MTNAYDTLARLLEYPAESYGELAEKAAQSVRVADPEAATHLESFVTTVKGLSSERLQELFIQTFDLNPVCVLEIGWQLFGDDYKRGEFLVRMREELRNHDLPESRELPDHLTRVLPLLERMDPEEADPFAALFVLPAVEKMLAGVKDKQNPFENLLLAIRVRLESHRVPAGPEVSRA